MMNDENINNDCKCNLIKNEEYNENESKNKIKIKTNTDIDNLTKLLKKFIEIKKNLETYLFNEKLNDNYL